MTVPVTPRIAGPYTTGGAGPFPFNYPVFQASDVLAVFNANGVQSTLVLNSDYTVALNADQTNSPGGTVTLSSLLVAAPNTLTLGSQVPQTQNTTFTNLGGFLPTVLNTCLDKLTILIQQLAVTVETALSFPLSDGNSVNGTLPAAAQRINGGAGSYLYFSGIDGSPGVASGISGTTVSVPLTPVVQASSLSAALTLLGGVSATAVTAMIASAIAPYLTTAVAAATYLTQTTATATYATISALTSLSNIVAALGKTRKNGTPLVISPYTTAAQTIAHGITKPDYCDVYLECITADLGYAVGDRVAQNIGSTSSGASSFAVSWNATIVRFVGYNGTAPTIPNATTGAGAVITTANWKLVAQPYVFA